MNSGRDSNGQPPRLVRKTGRYANIEKQFSQIENATQQKFDAIAIAVTSSTATVPALEQAQKQNVLVVGNGVVPNSNAVIKRGEDSELAGYNAGKFLCDSLKSGCSVGLLLGPPGIDQIRLRELGVQRALSACPQVKVAKALHNLSDLPNSLKAAEMSCGPTRTSRASTPSTASWRRRWCSHSRRQENTPET